MICTLCCAGESRPHDENVKSRALLAEYLLTKTKSKTKKKKKRKRNRCSGDDDREGDPLVGGKLGGSAGGAVHHMEVQTVCTGPSGAYPEPTPEGLLNHHHRHPHPQPPRDTPFLSHQDHAVRSACLQTGSWHGRFMHDERQANGGGRVLHAYADELAALAPGDLAAFAAEFMERAFAETGRRGKRKGGGGGGGGAAGARYALAVVHGAAAYLPDFLDYFAFNFPHTPVKMELLGKKDIETTTIAAFHAQVVSTVVSSSSAPW